MIKSYLKISYLILVVFATSCKLPKLAQKQAGKTLPKSFNTLADTAKADLTSWKSYFNDPYLTALIDTALANNQELNILQQEIAMAKNEAKARRGEYLPFLTGGGAASVEKVGRYTSQGANDATTPIAPGKDFPDPLPNFNAGLNFRWEIDIWRRLRNARNAALNRYLASIEARNFMVTRLVAEIASSYFELLTLDNQYDVLLKNIGIQQNALAMVKLEKDAARVTELAVKRFEAEVLKNQSNQYVIQQRIIATENNINFLVGRFPQPVQRSTTLLNQWLASANKVGNPQQLIENRTDIRQAQYNLTATGLDLKSAKAGFYPSLALDGGFGASAFSLSYLAKLPASLLFGIGGGLTGPIVNRNAIAANYLNANARQIQAAYHYEQTLLNAFLEVNTQMANVDNLNKNYALKSSQVDALTQSVEIAMGLYKNARADYMEVLLTQRDALEAKFELAETRLQQCFAKVNLYRAMGGGWK